jgi:hypothetical protein
MCQELTRFVDIRSYEGRLLYGYSSAQSALVYWGFVFYPELSQYRLDFSETDQKMNMLIDGKKISGFPFKEGEYHFYQSV